MLIVRSWLEDYVSLSDITDTDLAEMLTQLGLEVEEVLPQKPLDPGIVVGKILSIAPHEHADSLQLCSVCVNESARDSDYLSIVCGAQNIYEGMYVPVACVGATLPGGLKIQATKIRSVESQGMLCSADELALCEARQEGILDLTKSQQKQENYALGYACEDIFGFEDTVLDLAITPNRADCLGYMGVARDLAALLNRPFLQKSVDYPKAAFSTSDYVRLESFDGELCGRFSVLYMQGLKGDAESPFWLQRRLKLSGIRARSLLVDITNYVMYEWGQPMHAYDYESLASKSITTTLAREGTSFITLDGKTRELSGEDMVIVSGDTVLGLAGVMGGQNSEVSTTTSCCVLEVAEFSPVRVRRSAKHHKLHSEASHRFERGVDIRVLPQVVHRTAELVCSLHKELGLPLPEVACEMEDIYVGAEGYYAPRIALRLERARELLGLANLKAEECTDILDALECDQLDRRDTRLLYAMPSHRRDLVREVDLIEEIARLKGYESIPETLPVSSFANPKEHTFIAFKKQVGTALSALGLYEVVLYPFTSLQDYESFCIAEGHPLRPSLEIQNPLSLEQRFLQTFQVLALAKAHSHNCAYLQKSSRMFQIGRSYYSHRLVGQWSSGNALERAFFEYLGVKDSSPHLTPEAAREDRPVEKTFMSLLIGHPWQGASWQGPLVKVDFFHIKSILESFFRSFSEHKMEYKRIDQEMFPYLNYAQSAMVCFHGECIGYLGMIHPQVALNEDISLDELYGVAEIHLERWFALMQKHQVLPNYDIRSFPPCFRDISFRVKSSISHAQVSAAFASFPKKKHLRSAELFDVYSDDSYKQKGEKSMAYALSFASADRTLKDKEVAKELEHLRAYLQEALGAQLR